MNTYPSLLPESEDVLPIVDLRGAEVIKEAYRLFFKYFWPILAIVMVVALPVELVKNLYFYSPDERWMATVRRDNITQLFFLCLITPVVIFFILGKLNRDSGMTILECFKRAFRKWHLLIGYGMLSNLIIFAGLVLFIVPGVIFFIRLMFVSTVITIEGTRGKDPITISNLLTKGRGLRLFFYCAVAMLGLVPPILLGYFVDFWYGSRLSAVFLDLMIDFSWQVMTVLILLMYLVIRPQCPITLPETAGENNQ